MNERNSGLYEELLEISDKPSAFDYYTAGDLWTDEHISQRMLDFHLNKEIDVASRNAEFIRRSVAWMIDHFNIKTGTRIADFGCGPGLYAARLAKSGAEVTGIDFSVRSIEYAKHAVTEKEITIDYVHQNYLEYETDSRFDLILMLMCDFCALSPQQREVILRKFHSLLAPGGSILLDVYSMGAFDKRTEATVFEENLLDGFWSAEKYFGFLRTFKYEAERVVLDKYTIVEAAGTRTVYNWLQYFGLDSLKQEFANCGLDVTEVYNDVAGASYEEESDEFAVVAKRK